MKFVIRKHKRDFYGRDADDLASCTMRAALYEIGYVGLELGRDGLIVIEGGRA